MENRTTKCPMCAETIPLVASVCEYCGTRFAVHITGYCANCHQVREADANGYCKTCSGKILDFRVESRLVEEPVPEEPVPASVEKPSSARPVPSKAWFWALCTVLVLGISALVWNLAPRLSPGLLPATSTAISTFTPTPRVAAAPIPAWATDFAWPILSAIADRTPSLQDDFGAGSAGWLEESCEGGMKFMDDELVLTNCRVFRFDNNWPDFVLEMDVRIQSGSWTLHFRDMENTGHAVRINSNGNILLGFGAEAGNINFRGFDQAALSDNQVNHILLIGRGSNLAVYLNGQPFYFTENDLYLSGRFSYESKGGSAAMDNLRIWDISDIPVLDMPSSK